MGGHQGESTQWYGQNAKTFTSSQILGKTVEVQEMDVDRYGRVVAIVSVGDLVINRHLVEYGYAWVYHQYCKAPFCKEWAQVEAESKAKRRGLWKKPNVIPPWEYRRAKQNMQNAPSSKADQRIGKGCDCSGNLYNCADFKTQSEAQSCYEKCMRLKGRDVHKLDRDRNGRVCESLP